MWSKNQGNQRKASGKALLAAVGGEASGVGAGYRQNAVQRIESGKRFVTDIELKVIAQVLRVDYQALLDCEDS